MNGGRFQRTINYHSRIACCRIFWRTAFSILPRLGSWVRIPSPAPDFLKKISGLERSFGAAFCFPGLRAVVGEARGKQRDACRGAYGDRTDRSGHPSPSHLRALPCASGTIRSPTPFTLGSSPGWCRPLARMHNRRSDGHECLMCHRLSPNAPAPAAPPEP